MPVYEKVSRRIFCLHQQLRSRGRAELPGHVYNGIDLSLYPLQEPGGNHLVFLGRIHPDKGVHLAIEVARLSGCRYSSRESFRIGHTSASK